MKLRIAPEGATHVLVDALAVRAYDALLCFLGFPDMLDGASLAWLLDEVRRLRAQAPEHNTHTRDEDRVIGAAIALLEGLIARTARGSEISDDPPFLGTGR